MSVMIDQLVLDCKMKEEFCSEMDLESSAIRGDRNRDRESKKTCTIRHQAQFEAVDLHAIQVS